MKTFIFIALILVSSLKALTQDAIPLIPIINLQSQGAITQKELKPFQLSKEYYQIFKVLNVTNTISVEKLFKQNIPKGKVYYPLFNYKTLLILAKQLMASNEITDINCAKGVLINFANTFSVTTTSASGTSVTCDTTKRGELASKIAVLNSLYFKYLSYEPIQLLSSNTIKSSKKTINTEKTSVNLCLVSHDFRTDMNINLLNSQIGGNGQNAKFTLIENAYIVPDNSNLSTLFPFSSNIGIKNISFYKNIAFSPPTSNVYVDHVQRDISILFDDASSSIVDGVSKSSVINKIILFHNNCKLNSIYHEYEALLEAIVVSPKGSVLLLEFGAGAGNSFPAEKEPILYELIHFATKYKNIIVIEPAGNLNQDIATIPYRPKFVLDTICSDSNDSGAIIVGGAEANNTIDMSGVYRKVANSDCGKSNFGDRIDCYAQGELVNTNYRNHHSTSAASAIIAGIALDIQSLVKAKYGGYLTPIQMRYILTRPSTIKVKQFGFRDKYIPVITNSLLLELDRFFLDCPPNCPPEK